jgi:hypothetical protein
MVDLSMALVLCGLGVLYVAQQRASIIHQLAAAPAASGGLANVGINQ